MESIRNGHTGPIDIRSIIRWYLLNNNRPSTDTLPPEELKALLDLISLLLSVELN